MLETARERLEVARQLKDKTIAQVCASVGTVMLAGTLAVETEGSAHNASIALTGIVLGVAINEGMSAYGHTQTVKQLEQAVTEREPHIVPNPAGDCYN